MSANFPRTVTRIFSGRQSVFFPQTPMRILQERRRKFTANGDASSGLIKTRIFSRTVMQIYCKRRREFWADGNANYQWIFLERLRKISASVDAKFWVEVSANFQWTVTRIFVRRQSVFFPRTMMRIYRNLADNFGELWR